MLTFISSWQNCNIFKTEARKLDSATHVFATPYNLVPEMTSRLVPLYEKFITDHETFSSHPNLTYAFYFKSLSSIVFDWELDKNDKILKHLRKTTKVLSMYILMMMMMYHNLSAYIIVPGWRLLSWAQISSLFVFLAQISSLFVSHESRALPGTNLSISCWFLMYLYTDVESKSEWMKT